MNFTPPPHAVPIEYLESTGTQWIDTGVLATDTTGVMANVSNIFLDTSRTQCFFGVFGSDNRFALGLQARPDNLPFVWWNVATTLSQTINYANVSTVALNYLNSRTFSFGPEWTGLLTATYNASQTEIRIFNVKRMDNGQNGFAPGAVYRLHSMKISFSTNVVRDFIPVRVGRFGYLFDRVTGKFFANQGTGDFLLGPDIGTFPGRLNPMGVATWGAGWKPYDAEVKWLGSTGTQYIDTNFTATSNTSIKMQYSNQIATGTTSDAYFGSRTGAGSNAFGALQYYDNSHSKLLLRWDYGQTTTKIADVSSGSHSLQTTGNSITYDSTTVSGGTFSSSGLSIWIFAVNNNGSALVPHRGLHITSFQTFENGSLVRDFIPVRKGTTGYLYDRANPHGGPLGNGLYPNPGTGDFELGPDVA